MMHFQPPLKGPGAKVPCTGIQEQSLSTTIPGEESLYKMPIVQPHAADERHEQQPLNQVHLPGQVNSNLPVAKAPRTTSRGQQDTRQGNLQHDSSSRVNDHTKEIPHGLENSGYHQKLTKSQPTTTSSKQLPQTHGEELTPHNTRVTFASPAKPECTAPNINIILAPTIADKPYRYPESMIAMTVAVMSSFVLLMCGCWWSLWCTYLAIAFGASSGTASSNGNYKLANEKLSSAICCIATAWVATVFGVAFIVGVTIEIFYVQ